ncbi:flagellar basal body P-ring formation chaperone FlgA [Desulfuromonas acetoxidans]|uniref:flagellar basal body P-ring formation chaperone FlgA n=1 Tax=Desulfuromonas acetoxidans TaxID=891 RepID=UPI000053A8E6|nr:flagellar basal body P-ring formation chaperone FlgA [Desulfuromonas acetoxidans]MBF0644969.1 flagellar basal body P-ring formation protein FlgA [Desulfuromonas acetoxidans]NVD25626.1 flagellar basal body P-ring formation protein FlgA [Desulfuromonas acetoxidans]NVE17678.1 flagellar basal body P-ring formation protein FlgA [Desulfuromonas acetoxidans]
MVRILSDKNRFFWLLLVSMVIGLLWSSLAVAGGTTITNQDIQRTIKTYLNKAQQRINHVDYTFEPYSKEDSFTLPAGKLRIDVLPAVKKIIGSRHFTVVYRVDGRTVKSVTVRGKLLVKADVVVAQQSLKRGTIISAEDVSLVHLDVSRIREPIFDLKNVVGKLVARNVRAGQPVEFKSVETPPLVHKGSFVKLVARRSGMMLTAIGIALEDGSKGEVIRVQNNRSKKVVMAQVVGPDLVEVEF